MATAKKVWYYRKPIVYSNLVLEDHSLLNAFNLKKCTSLFGSVGFFEKLTLSNLTYSEQRGLIYEVLNIGSNPALALALRERERERENGKKCVQQVMKKRQAKS
jgi:hypothetical protein